MRCCCWVWLEPACFSGRLVREARLDIAGVPTRIFDAGNASGLLLLGHGGGHSKDSPRFVQLARDYALSTTLAVVSIDAVDHGERRPQNASSALPTHWHSRTAARMVDDWMTVSHRLADIGPPVAYAGFSMGAIFGLCTVAAMPHLKAAVLVVGGIPTGDWVDDEPLRPLLLEAARAIVDPQVLMINKTDDALFAPAVVHDLFNEIASPSKRLMFWPGDHDDWPPEAIRHSEDFLTQLIDGSRPRRHPGRQGGA